MAQPSPLPSFNSHSNCDLYVVATQIKESRKEPSELLIPSLVNLNIAVSATFRSDNPWNDRIFEGLTMVGRRALISSTIESPAECREKIRNILADVGVPPQIGECTWKHRYLNDEQVYVMPGVEDVDRLVENVCWFLYEVKTQPHNKDFTLLPVNLAISKRIMVPDAEFEAWCSWYEKMVDVDPDSGTEYAKANGGPRTEEELLNELSCKFNAATGNSIEALKHVKIEDSNLLRYCSICF